MLTTVNASVTNEITYHGQTNTYVVRPTAGPQCPADQPLTIAVTPQIGSGLSRSQLLQGYPAPPAILLARHPAPRCACNPVQTGRLADTENLATGESQDYVFHATRRFCNFCEERKLFPHSITALSSEFSITRRRFYDVLNVLESMGVCEKVGIDSIRWLGCDNIKPTLTRLRKEMDVDNPGRTLDELFASGKLIGIGKTNILLLMLFPALRVKRLNLKKAAALLAHGVVKYRTMLGKLCQIAYILRAVDVVNRTALSCEIELRDDLCDYPIFDSPLTPLEAPDTDDDWFSVSSLLSRPRTKQAQDWLSERRRVFENCQFASDAW